MKEVHACSFSDKCALIWYSARTTPPQAIWNIISTNDGIARIYFDIFILLITARRPSTAAAAVRILIRQHSQARSCACCKSLGANMADAELEKRQHLAWKRERTANIARIASRLLISAHARNVRHNYFEKARSDTNWQHRGERIIICSTFHETNE